MKHEIRTQLDDHQKRLDDLGRERNTPHEQLSYLTEIASHFQRLVSLALTANHGADNLFESSPALRIAPSVMSRMKTFSEDLENYGHAYSFMKQEESDDEDNMDAVMADTSLEASEDAFDTRKEDDLDDLTDILHPSGRLSHPLSHGMKGWLSKIFQGNRGFELGTFNATILATAMNRQCFKWEDISLGFISDVIVLVHKFIDSALASVCSDSDIREALVGKLSDKLFERYKKAIINTRFLLEVESSDTPMTVNHYFNDDLQKR